MTNTNTNTKLLALTEIVGAAGTANLSKSEADSFINDPVNFINANLDIDISDFDINVIENTGNDINLVLPYFTFIDDFQAELLKDENLNEISGGEIFISIFVVGGVVAGLGIAVAAKVTSITATVALCVGLGVAAGTVGAGAVAGAGVGIHEAATGEKASGGKK